MNDPARVPMWRSPDGDHTDWRHYAACRDIDPELFFPIGKAGPVVAHQVAQARRVCAGCQVREPCLHWAVASGQDAGVWGGTTEEERRRLRRQLRLAPSQDR